MNVQMVELLPDREGLLRAARALGVDLAADGDGCYAVHAWLKAAFQDLAPCPFRVYDRPGGVLRILGYAGVDADTLRQQLQANGTPFVVAACPPDAIASRPMPKWSSGQRLSFEVLACPVVRLSRTGAEKDAFLRAVDNSRDADERPARERIYLDWLRERLAPAASLEAGRLAGFRLVWMLRRSRGNGEKSGARRLLRPWALLRGSLRVEDPVAFGHLVATGVGRHRSFGYGMLLLAPP